MNSILTIIGFIVLYFIAHRLASIKHERPFGFRPPKKNWFDRLFKK